MKAPNAQQGTALPGGARRSTPANPPASGTYVAVETTILPGSPEADCIDEILLRKQSGSASAIPRPAGERSAADSAVDPERTLYHTAQRVTAAWPPPPFIVMSDVARRPIDWLWYGRLARGKLSLQDGDPNLGKTFVMLDVAARISTGRAMPDGKPFGGGAPSGVIFVYSEDGLEDTIGPRLDAAGADSGRIVALHSSEVTFPDDLTRLASAVDHVGAVLVCFDPLLASLARSYHSYVDADVRAALAPLTRLADEKGFAILGNRHLTKGGKEGGQTAIQRGLGGIGFAAVARCSWLVAPDPERAPDGCVIATIKRNLTRRLPSLRYRLEEVGDTARVEWTGESEVTADQLAGFGVEGYPTGALAEAKAWLTERLADCPALATTVKADAIEYGISAASLHRAKRDLRVDSTKVAGYQMGGPWQWSLPDPDQGP